MALSSRSYVIELPNGPDDFVLLGLRQLRVHRQRQHLPSGALSLGELAGAVT